MDRAGSGRPRNVDDWFQVGPYQPGHGRAFGLGFTTFPWYQPNINVQTGLFFNATGVAPHAVTTRDTYTVPADRIAIVTNATILIMRDLAAGVVGLAHIFLASSGSIPDVLHLYELSNTVGTSQHVELSYSHVMRAGDTLTLQTSDASTGGSHIFNGNLAVMEFDGPP